MASEEDVVRVVLGWSMEVNVGREDDDGGLGGVCAKLRRAYGGCLWHWKAMKDVASCEKSWGAAGRL